MSGKHRTFILGAGASVEFFNFRYSHPLCVDSLTKSLCDKKSWEVVLEKVSESLGSRMRDIDVSVEDVFTIVDVVRNSFPDQNNSIFRQRMDFERIISFIDKVAEVLLGSNNPKIVRYDAGGHFVTSLCIIRDSIRGVLNKKEWRIVPFWAREVIHSAVAQYMMGGEIKLVTDYFTSEFENNKRTNVYSLNYDLLLHEALNGSEIISGFQNGNFSPKQFYLSRNTIAYIHGSQLFYGTGGAICMADSYQNAFNYRANSLWSSDYSTVHQRTNNASLVTGDQKENAMQVGVYASYYLKMARDVLDADELVCIGYGFCDEHINVLIRQRLLFDRSVFVVDCQRSHDAMTLCSHIGMKLARGDSLSYSVDSLREFTRGALEFYKKDR